MSGNDLIIAIQISVIVGFGFAKILNDVFGLGDLRVAALVLLILAGVALSVGLDEPEYERKDVTPNKEHFSG